MDINIIRNNQRYGPYDEQSLLSYVNSGQILLHDKAIAVGEKEPQTVGYYLKRANLKPHIQDKGNILMQIAAIGGELLFPRTTLFSKQFLLDQRFLILALVGLFPMLIMQRNTKSIEQIIVNIKATSLSDDMNIHHYS